MKILLGVLLLVGVASAGEKPYVGVNVTIRATTVKAGVLRIEARSTIWRPVESQEYRSFVLSCQVNASGCVSPEVGNIYVLQAPTSKHASCDGYELGREKRIPVCLVSVR